MTKQTSVFKLSEKSGNLICVMRSFCASFARTAYYKSPSSKLKFDPSVVAHLSYGFNMLQLLIPDMFMRMPFEQIQERCSFIVEYVRVCACVSRCVHRGLFVECCQFFLL